MRVIKLDRTSTHGRESISGVIDTGDGTEPVSFTPKHPRWNAVVEAVDSYYTASSTNEELAEALRSNFRLGDAVNDRLVTVAGVLDGRLQVEGNRVTFDGDPIDNVLESHILRLLNEDGTPRDTKNWGAFSRFVENLYSNMSEYVRNQLFGWLSYETLSGRGFTLTEDGCFIGYKGCAGTPDAPVSVNHGTAVVNGKRVTGAIPNPVGAIVEMPRSEVQFDPRVGCATGLHVGTLNYATNWARGALLTVKVNPRDVVSVPVECDAQKIRTCRYTVLEVVQSDNPYTTTTYYSDDSEVTAEGSTEGDGTRTGVNPGDVVSFDYTTLDGRHGNYEVTVRHMDNYLLDGDLPNGSPRSFRTDRITNLVNHTVSSETDTEVEEEAAQDEAEAAPVDRGNPRVTPGTVVTVRYRKRPSHPVRTYTLRVTSSDQDYLNGDLEDGSGRRTFVWDRIVSVELADADADANKPSVNSDTSGPRTLTDWVTAAARSAGLNLTITVGDPSDDDDPGTEEDEEIRRHGYGNAWDAN